MVKSFCTSDGEFVWVSEEDGSREPRCYGSAMVEVSDNSSHELEIATARGGDGDGMCQTSGERKDAENDEVDDEEGFVQHDRGSWVVSCVKMCLSIRERASTKLDTTRGCSREKKKGGEGGSR